VLNFFDRACNLVYSQGNVLAVVTSQRGLTPFALVVASGEPALFRIVSESSGVQVQGGQLRIGSLQIDFSTARLWSPAPDWPAIRLLFAEAGQLDVLAAMAFGHGPAGSLLELFGPKNQPSSLPDALRSRAQPGAMALVAGMRSGSVEQAVVGAGRLAGLGGGLTPAGDDFVLGVLLASWAGLYGAGAEGLCGKIAEAAAPRTTSLSAAYLRAAARGECSEYWHQLFAALLVPDAAALRLALSALLAVGHTSGADALAGFLASRLAAAAGISVETALGG